jgi:hypothetical protein
MSETKGLAHALAILQTRLPEIKKDQTAKVKTKTGADYSYKYVDLAQISRALLPVLGDLGLSFIATPTTIEGRFVLAYKLLHVSGESESGVYPLPSDGSPQSMGSAITYARRYCLSAVTGIAPDEDDDGVAANANYHHQAARPQQQPEPQWEQPLPDAVTDQPWMDRFESRADKAGTAGELKGLWTELVDKHKRLQVTDADADTLKTLLTHRKTELEESPA